MSNVTIPIRHVGCVPSPEVVVFSFHRSCIYFGMHWLVYNRCENETQDQHRVFLFKEAFVASVCDRTGVIYVSASQAVSRRSLCLVFCCRSLAAAVRPRLCPEPEF